MADSPIYISGLGACATGLAELKERYAPKKTLLVTGRGSYAASGAQVAVEAVFDPSETIRFFDFEVNPKMIDAQRGVEIAREAGVDLILAIGGGSPMDMGKIIKAFYTDPFQAEALVRGEVQAQDPGIPLIAVPTTAGSGSEATHFAVAYIGKDKFSLASQLLLPDAVVLDGKLLATNSSYQRAVNGLDAMAQAIESYWAAGSTEESRSYSREGIQKTAKHLPLIVQGGGDDTLQNMIEAANLAGKAINISKTTAAHAYAYAFTGFHDVPHGHAVWMTLPDIFQIHATVDPEHVSDKRGAEHLSAIMKDTCEILGLQGPNYGDEMKSFLHSLDLSSNMIEMGAKTPEERKFVSQQVNMQRMGNNPVGLTEDHVASIFKL